MKSLVRSLMLSCEDWLEILETHYNIDVVRDGPLVSLKYNQIESPMHEPIVQECRGMVVDVERRQILAWPYNKFWNHGEGLAAPIDWATACVLEKLDGSLITLWWNPSDERWSVASSGTPRASGNFGSDDTRSFRDAFWQTFMDLGMELPDEGHREVCFMFEFCAQENRIVVRHDNPCIVLHGARNVVTGFEWSMDSLIQCQKAWNWEVVKSYPISTIDECLAAACALDPIANEGFVVVDANFNRVKVKSPRYVVLHHMKGEATPRRAIELWQTGETEELLSHFPEMAGVIIPVQDRLNAAAGNALRDFEANRGAATRKDFALAVKDAPWSAVTFKLYGLGGTPDLGTAKWIMRGLSLSALDRMVLS